MDSTIIILILCGLVITSYLFEIIAKKTGIPAVLFLILLGMALNRMTFYFETPSIDYLRLIPVIGTVGLILIVFEGALEIEYNPEKKKVFFMVLLSSVIMLGSTSVSLSFIFRYYTDTGFYRCFLNSIPFAIISSAIAIPSAAHLAVKSREFITIESSLSDILGIILFNYTLTHSYFSVLLPGKIMLELIIVTAVSLLFCLLLIYLLKTIEHYIKFILILTVLVFLYTLGEFIHVSSLIMVLMFGLLLKNINLLKMEFINRHFNNVKFIYDFNFLQQLTSEGVFLVKTFFFIIFGFIIHPAYLFKFSNIRTALIIIIVIYSVRLFTLYLLRREVLPELFYAPRGLITILLYLSLPAAYYIEILNTDVLFLVVIMTGVIMILGSFRRRIPSPE